MKIEIVRQDGEKTVAARIITPPPKMVLPSITDGWRFNFKSHSKKKGFQIYILVCEETPDIIEGCLIFQLRDTVEPYMAFVKTAPHNRGNEKRFAGVAGCLIAYACRLSFTFGKDHFKGWLAFDVMEEKKEDEIKLMSVYSRVYGALRWGETTMVISPETGEKLINEYLQKR